MADNEGENPQHREATDCFMQARTALKNGEVGKAETMLKRALKLWPDNYNYTLQLAKLALQVNKNELEIEELLQKTATLNATATEPRLLLASHYEKSGKTTRAISIYKGVLSMDPNNLLVRRKLAQNNIDPSGGMTFSALSQKMQSLFPFWSIEPDEVKDLARPNSPVSAPAKPKPMLPAEPIAQISLNKDPGAKPMVAPLATVPLKTFGEDTLFTYLKGDSATTDDIPIYTAPEPEPTPSLQSQDNWDELMQSLQHDSEIYEVDGRVPLEIGVSYIEMGLYEEAVEELQEAWRIFVSKGDEEALRSGQILVDCLISLERYEEAIEWCNKGIDLAGRGASSSKIFLHRAATIYERLGNKDLAAQLLAEVGDTVMPDVPKPHAQPSAAFRYALRPKRGLSGPDIELDSDQNELLLGRSPKAQINIDSQRVSKDHSMLKFTATGLVLIGLSKTNGTFLNGEKLEPDTEYPVEPGDLIGLGKTIDLELISM